MRDKRITFRLTLQDDIAVNAIRDHLRKIDPWADRTAVMRFALQATLEAIESPMQDTSGEL